METLWTLRELDEFLLGDNRLETNLDERTDHWVRLQVLFDDPPVDIREEEELL